MAILINNEVEVAFDFNDLFTKVKKVTFEKLNIRKAYDLSVNFVDDKTIREINKNYRNIDSKTDVISFAMLDNLDIVSHDGSDLDLGDIFISTETAKEQALSLNQSVEREILFLFIHGLLHLLGYDHIDKSDEKVMFTLQEEIINEVIRADSL
ncbi:MAG TPA: rRNA maturation RNase YbeY [Erysipelotrichaceae bacterium]|nr:rRNA maturation RNase YbeY [Erysipelotrichaceae bacterium]